MTQPLKKKIDLGQIGNASTGDILYDGGEKINSNFDGLFNAFADQRYLSAGDGVENMYVHATGYYQKVTQDAFRTPIELGTQYDIDATSGAVSPILPKGKRGEGVIFVNFNGSISVNNPLVIQPPNGSSIVGVSDTLTVTAPFSRVECWCVSDSGNPVWNYKVSSLFGESQSPIDGTYNTYITGTTIQIAHMSEYKTIKLLVTANKSDNTDARQSELNLLIDTLGKSVIYNEFAVNAITDPELVNISFSINLNNYIIMTVKPKFDNTRVAVKSIVTQKLGSV